MLRIVFDGAAKGKVNQITFMDIKTRKSASLNRHQQLIRDAVKDYDVTLELL